MLDKAIALASDIHCGQTRENGDPYILHPIRVMMAMDTEEEKIVAILHDVIEDSDMLASGLLSYGIHITEAIRAISRKKGEVYGKYIDRVGQNELATKVKLADLKDNMNLLEIPVIIPYHLERTNKYYDAYRKLELL